MHGRSMGNTGGLDKHCGNFLQKNRTVGTMLKTFF
jgi:hypothetical protein